jgi:hypothetical protein
LFSSFKTIKNKKNKLEKNQKENISFFIYLKDQLTLRSKRMKFEFYINNLFARFISCVMSYPWCNMSFVLILNMLLNYFIYHYLRNKSFHILKLYSSLLLLRMMDKNFHYPSELFASVFIKRMTRSCIYCIYLSTLITSLPAYLYNYSIIYRPIQFDYPPT